MAKKEIVIEIKTDNKKAIKSLKGVSGETFSNKNISKVIET